MVHHCRKRTKRWLAQISGASLTTQPVIALFLPASVNVVDERPDAQKKLCGVAISSTIADKRCCGSSKNNFDGNGFCGLTLQTI